MYKGKTFLAVIPARGGSKGVPKKNIVKINKKPLIQYTIEAAKASEFIDEIIVSTDDTEIAKVCNKLGVDIPFLRPNQLATDQAKTIDTILHVIGEQKKRKKVYDYIVLLQPTQPLRKAWHIDDAIKKIIKNNQESLVSITEVNEHPILMRTFDKNDRLVNVLNQNSTVRRQELSKVYKVNGAIYINQVSVLNQNTSLNDNISGYIMDKKYDLDIDDFDDLKTFQNILAEKDGC